MLHTFNFGMNFTSCLDELSISYELLVPKAVVNELQKLKKKGYRNANLALKIIERFTRTINTNCDTISVDDCVIATAKEQQCSIIATTDLELKKKARNEGFNVLYIRNKSRYELMD